MRRFQSQKIILMIITSTLAKQRATQYVTYIMFNCNALISRTSSRIIKRRYES
jgi:hypothetical protein